jgi:DNA-directed RNA polymerase subunit K/omega
LGAADLQRRLDELELATVSAVRALQMDVEGDPGVPSATVLRKARQAIR